MHKMKKDTRCKILKLVEDEGYIYNLSHYEFEIDGEFYYYIKSEITPAYVVKH